MKVYEALRLLQAMPTDFLELLGDIDDAFTHVMPEWSLNDWPDEYGEALRASEHSSGWRHYPVMGPLHPSFEPELRARYNPMWARRNLPLWVGEYGATRLALLDDLAAYFEQVDK